MYNFKLIDITALSQSLCQQPIMCNLKYATEDNFTGEPLPGFHAQAQYLALLAPKAAHQLCRAQNLFNDNQLGILIYDAYHPIKTHAYLKKWTQCLSVERNPIQLSRKSIHYPNFNRAELLINGYINESPQHSYGNTIAFTLVKLDNRIPLNMGTCFDFFDVKSQHGSEAISKEAQLNRHQANEIMTSLGFINDKQVWWRYHYPPGKLNKPLNAELTHEAITALCTSKF